MATLVMPGWPNVYNMLITILVDYGLTESCIWLSTLYSWQMRALSRVETSRIAQKEW